MMKSRILEIQNITVITHFHQSKCSLNGRQFPHIIFSLRNRMILLPFHIYCILPFPKVWSFCSCLKLWVLQSWLRDFWFFLNVFLTRQGHSEPRRSCPLSPVVNMRGFSVWLYIGPAKFLPPSLGRFSSGCEILTCFPHLLPSWFPRGFQNVLWMPWSTSSFMPQGTGIFGYRNVREFAALFIRLLNNSPGHP